MQSTPTHVSVDVSPSGPGPTSRGRYTAGGRLGSIPFQHFVTETNTCSLEREVKTICQGPSPNYRLFLNVCFLNIV